MMMNVTQIRPRLASSKHPSRPKPKGSGQPTRTRGSLANDGRAVEGAGEQGEEPNRTVAASRSVLFG